ncbi:MULTISPECIES: Asp23/Gls24 family envelope stress response protein [unclassified Ligilactobacillus]|uniref:Asp23/Gls24 family envelope stress response protein n=1 Tax=unclassified Ligilactobacillus TaxID=2767920 RepID=UPI00385244E4
MAVKIQNQFGSIDIDNNVIASVVGGAATEVFGIVGMASKNQIRDNLNEILKRDNFAKGVVVRQDGEQIAVDVYIIVGYGTKISEVCRNVQNKVKYNLESMLGITADAVNVIVQGVRVIDVEAERR